MKPLLQRRTFWKGVITGAVAMTIILLIGVMTVVMLAPKELSQGVHPTWGPVPHYSGSVEHTDIPLSPCDTRGKDCVVFDEEIIVQFDVIPHSPDVIPHSPFEAPTNTVPEPGTLSLLGMAFLLMLVKKFDKARKVSYGLPTT